MQKRIRSNIPFLCKKNKVSRIMLSEKTGIPYATILRYVRGERDCPATDAILIARTLGVTVEELYQV